MAMTGDSVQISEEAYQALEQEVQELRLYVLSEAQCLAAKKKAGAVTRRHVLDALKGVVKFLDARKEVKRHRRNAPHKRQSIDIPHDAYLFLEGRLHRLRLLTASLVRKRSANPQPADVNIAWRLASRDLDILLADDDDS